MPNWCENTFAVTGSHEALAEFVGKAFGLPAIYPPTSPQEEPEGPYTETYLCFNATVPTPQEVIDLGYSIPYSKTSAIDIVLGTYPEPLDGYHWCLKNWGTKWDIYSLGITPEEMGWDEDCTELEAVFDTAWGPPNEWFAKLVEMFPALNFTLHYEECGMFFAGDITSEDGEISYYNYTNEECKELFHRDDDEDDDWDEDETVVTEESPTVSAIASSLT